MTRLRLRLRFRVKSLVNDLPLAIDFQQRHVIRKFDRRVVEHDDADAGVARNLDAFNPAFALSLVWRWPAGEARGEFGGSQLIEFAVAERKDFGLRVKSFPHVIAVAGRVALEVIFKRDARRGLLGALSAGYETPGRQKHDCNQYGQQSELLHFLLLGFSRFLLSSAQNVMLSSPRLRRWRKFKRLAALLFVGAPSLWSPVRGESSG